MGFIPIILTMGGAILLFFMAVNQSLLAKKSAMIQLQKGIIEAFRRFGKDYPTQESFSTAGLSLIDEGYRALNSGVDIKNNVNFEAEVRIPYRDLKVTIDQYNRLVRKKPYSFVAKVMGHKAIG